MATAVKDKEKIQDVSNLADKTVFIRVTFGVLGNRRKVLAEQVIDKTLQNEMDMLRVSKQLFDSEELRAINSADAKMKEYLRLTCLPGIAAGVLALPTGLIQMVHNRCTQYKEYREELVQKFIDRYDDLMQESAMRLGTLYRAHEYPSKADVADTFYFDFAYISFGVPGQLKTVAPEIFKEQVEKTEKLMQEAAEDIRLLLRKNVFDMVSHLQDRLTPTDDGKRKRFHSVAVTNLTEFLNLFNLRNVTDDKQLQGLIDKLRQMMQGIDTDKLHTNDAYRAALEQKMAGVSKQLGELVEEKGRKFRDS